MNYLHCAVTHSCRITLKALNAPQLCEWLLLLNPDSSYKNDYKKKKQQQKSNGDPKGGKPEFPVAASSPSEQHSSSPDPPTDTSVCDNP